jgi:hypothetical protein
MSDLISRQAAIEALDKIFPADPMRNDYTQGIACGAALAKTYVEQLPSAQPESYECACCEYRVGDLCCYAEVHDTESCEDAVSRQAVYNVLDKMPIRGFKKDGETIHGLISLSQVNSAIINLPSAQPEMNLDEWCTDCKEYDHERHCCPRWNRVIRQTLKDAQPEIIRCKDCAKREFCRTSTVWAVRPGDDWFCADAERREDG